MTPFNVCFCKTIRSFTEHHIQYTIKTYNGVKVLVKDLTQVDCKWIAEDHRWMMEGKKEAERDALERMQIENLSSKGEVSVIIKV